MIVECGGRTFYLACAYAVSYALMLLNDKGGPEQVLGMHLRHAQLHLAHDGHEQASQPGTLDSLDEGLMELDHRVYDRKILVLAESPGIGACLTHTGWQ
jgi:hypothetical protein